MGYARGRTHVGTELGEVPVDYPEGKGDGEADQDGERHDGVSPAGGVKLRGRGERGVHVVQEMQHKPVDRERPMRWHPR